MIKKKQYISEFITLDIVNSWGLGDNILIKTPPDTGKTFFVKNVLSETGKKILIISNRTNLKAQIDKSVKNSSNIDVVNYQQLEHDIINNRFNIEPYSYLVLEEVHYFFEDAKFNYKTDLVLNEVINNTNITKIFISGTPQLLEFYFNKKEYKFDEIHDEIKPNYSFIDSVSVFQDFNTIDTILQTISSDEKAIVFSNKIDDLYKLSQKYNGAFICSQSHKKYSKKINQEELKSIQDNERFNKRFLFTTTCLDNGVNIVDEEVKHIILDIHDKVSFIQCLGRKRIKGNEKIHLYFIDVKGTVLGGSIREAKKNINLVNRFNEVGEFEFINEMYKKDNKYNHNLIYDYADKTTNTTHKKINECLYYKYLEDMLFYTLINGDNEEHIKKSFIKIICDELGFKYKDVVFIEKAQKQDEIVEYLESIKGKRLYKKGQQELIKKLNVVRNGVLRTSVKSLNASLEEDKIPYVILHSKEKKKGKKPVEFWKVKKLTKNKIPKFK